MKNLYVVGLLFLILMLPRLASAQENTGVLRYIAEESCPNEGRFRDEVSARIGYQPFNGDGAPLEIRLVASGNEFLGTLQLGEFTRVISSATCEESFRVLVETLAVHLDTEPVVAPAERAAPTPPVIRNDPADGRIRLQVSGTNEARIFYIVTRRQLIQLGNVSGESTETNVHTLCLVPCAHLFEPGRHELGFSPPGVTGPTRNIHLDLLENGHLNVEITNRSHLRWIGRISAIVGGLALASTFLFGRNNKAVLATGVVLGGIATGAGITLMFQRDRIEWSFEPASAQ